MERKASEIAREILEYGLKASDEGRLNIPPDYHNLAREVYDVPERPAEWEPAFAEMKYPGRIVMVSGGLDSTVSWLMARGELGKDPEAYYVNMGQAYAPKELEAMESMGIPHQVIDVDEPPHLQDGKWKHIHPGRNFYYLTLVAEQATQPSQLILSALDGEITQQGGDKSIVFFREANRLLAKEDPPVQVVTPLQDMTKTDIVKWAIENGHQETVEQTISCFSAEGGRCGECQSCLRTWVGFYNNGIELPFSVHPMEGARQYVDKYRRVMTEAHSNKDYSHYSSKRIAQTLGAFDGYEESKK
jgi:7-cyano-7-deazaguanine synthase in queuosine biosynthesis